MRKYCIIVKRVQYLRFLFEAARKASAGAARPRPRPDSRLSGLVGACKRKHRRRPPTGAQERLGQERIKLSDRLRKRRRRPPAATPHTNEKGTGT